MKSGEKKKEKETALAYLGPSFYGIIQHGMVLRGKFPEKLEMLTEQYPFLQELFVPLEKLAESRNELRGGAGRLSIVYKKAEELREGKNV